MKNLTLLVAAAIIFMGCTKDQMLWAPVKTPVTASPSTIAVVINKATPESPVQLLINHDELNMEDTGVNMIKFDGSISWGDGNTDNFSDSALGAMYQTHIYAAAGVYNININLNKPDGAATFSIADSSMKFHADQVLSISGLNGFTGSFMKYFVLQDDKLPAIDLSANSYLEYLYMNGNNLTTVNISNNPLLKVVQFKNNRLTTAAINSILIALDNAGITRGQVNLSQQTPAAPPGVDGDVARGNLISKGWTVITD